VPLQIDEDDLKAIMAVADPDQDGRISMKVGKVGSACASRATELCGACIIAALNRIAGYEHSIHGLILHPSHLIPTVWTSCSLMNF
jgi:hypothetical protein